nr:ATP-dependent Clp protease ATP-binding subunit [uncultured Alloprevotella sp.]
MTYELSPGLTQVLAFCRKAMQEKALSDISTDCLLLGLLHDERNQAMQILQSLSCPIEELKQQIMTRLDSLQKSPLPSSDALVLSIESRRLLRLTLLEARSYGEEMANELHLLLAILHDSNNAARTLLNTYNITYSIVTDNLPQIPQIEGSFGFSDDEQSHPPMDGEERSQKSPNAMPTPSDGSSSPTPIIDNFGTDLTEKAAQGALDSVVGREKEILRVAQILSRRKKNNPIIIGEPGVGKSAIVEGLSQLIASHKVPRLLQNKRIIALDMASIVAGTQFRGQFEERLRRLIKELNAHPEIVLFIDEIHTIIGAGSAPGSLDAANILKPALARGEVQCIGATTINEYRKTIEKDGALARRFQSVLLEPTTAEETLQILHNIKERYEEHHNVAYTPEALSACVHLTERYITDRSLPDKAIDALDEAGSQKHLLGLNVPANIVAMEQKIVELKQQKDQAAKEQDYERAARYRDESVQLQTQLNERNRQWLSEQKTYRQTITEEDIANVVSTISGVPIQRVVQSEATRLKRMKAELESRVVAQDTAIEKLVRAITRNSMGLKGHDRPVGTFLFVGPTGVGKTYLVKCLAEQMFGRKDSLIRIDMSEYGEKYSTSRLVGAPPGYVGYEEGGQLTEKVRRHPYSVILLDEIEKAHSDVFNTLLQVMDEGRMTDGNGVTVDFRNTIIIMTSNTGTRQIREFGKGIGFHAGEVCSNSHQYAEAIVKKALQRQFAPEFLNRLDDIIMFQPLEKTDAQKIAKIELDLLCKRIAPMNLHLDLSTAALDYVVEKGFDAQYGARSLKRAIQTNVEDCLCDLLLESADSQAARTVRFDMAEGELKVNITEDSVHKDKSPRVIERSNDEKDANK